MRRALDGVYAAALWAAALCILTIATLVLAQVAGRLLDGALSLLGLPRSGFMVPSLAEFGGFLLAAAIFLAMAGALRAGDHIRVTMLLHALPPGLRRAVEALSLGMTLAVALVGVWQLGAMAADSLKFGEVSYGIIPIPLWLPQAAATLGLAVFALALADETLAALRRGRPDFAAAEDARERGE